MTRPAETAIARGALELLAGIGFECFQEVGFGFGGPRADIVGTRERAGTEVCIVEAKTCLSFDLIAQVENWKPHAHSCYVAIPPPKTWNAGRRLAYEILADRGIGVIESGGARAPKFVTPPTYNTDAKPEQLLAVLRPEHKTALAAGSPGGGGAWSPWRGSVAALVAAVGAAPGRPLRDVLASIRHHWRSLASARTNVVDQIERGLIPLRLERSGRVVLVFPIRPGKTEPAPAG